MARAWAEPPVTHRPLQSAEDRAGIKRKRRGPEAQLAAENLARPMADLAAALKRWETDRAWWAHIAPVAYVWLCRAERRGAIVPWSPKGS